MENDPGIGAARTGAFARFTVIALAMMVLGLACAAVPARAQGGGLPAQLVVTVAPPNGHAPRPTGNVVVSVNGRPLLTVPLVRGLDPLTSATPLLNAGLAALGQRVTIGYSGDNNYEASDGLVITVPTSKSALTITPRPRDLAAPAIEIVSPGDGLRYERGEPVLAIYSCKDPEDRSPVTKCEGSVPTGSPVDTGTSGTFTFTVSASDNLGNSSPKTVTFTVGSSARPSAPTPATSPGRPPAAAPRAPRLPLPPVAPGAAAIPLPSVELPAVEAPEEGSEAPAPSKDEASAKSKRAAPSDAAEPQPPAANSDEAPPSVRQELTSYDPRSEPEKTFGILAAGFTLLGLGIGGGLARGGGVAKAGSAGGPRGAAPGGRVPKGGAPKAGGRPSFSGLSSYQGVEVRHLAAGFGAVALGDRSRTWRWPATERVDHLAAALPVAVARRSPLLGRVFADSAYVRAILGSASLLLPLTALALGIAAVNSTGGEALPPSTALVIAIAVIGVIDAASGLVALTTFGLGVLVLGGLTTGDDVRFMLGLGALWAVVPVLAGVTRPLRRPPTSGVVGVWDRGADFIVVSLLGAWTVQRIVLALPGLAGVELEIDEHANAIALFVLGALVLRLALETLAAHLYPLRLDSTAAAAFPNPSRLTMIGSAVGRTAIYAFLAFVLIGDVWQLYAAAGLFLLTQIIWVYPDKVPNFPALYRAIPKGITQFTVFLFGYTIAWLLMSSWMDMESKSFFPNVLVGFGLVGLILPLPLLFGRSGEARKIGWGKRLLGLAVLVIAILQVRGYLLV